MKNKCQVFTPEEYIEEMLDGVGYYGNSIMEKHILENSCGDGNILKKIVTRYIQVAQNNKCTKEKIRRDLETYIIGFEIDDKILKVCIKNLDSVAEKFGIKQVKWNIKNYDYLKVNFKNKFDFIVGNPPYIMYKNIEKIDREYLKSNFLSCNKGKFDYCYAFIDKSITELNGNGKMSYIIPSSIFKNVYAKDLRIIMKDYLEKIIDYKESSVFGKVLTSPAIIYLNKSSQLDYIEYKDVDHKKSYLINKDFLNDKWIFSNDVVELNSVSCRTFGDFFKVSNSAVTMLNKAYVINQKDILNETEEYIQIKNFFIEKKVLRNAASPRSFSNGRKEYIIFPYNYVNGILNKIEEYEFQCQFPEAFKYLHSFSDELKNRSADKSSKWYEYGRSQALSDLNQEKILISSVVTTEVKSYRLDKDTIPYSGFYIVPIAEKNLEEAEEILRSQKFLSYLSVRGINANGKSLRFSVTDISNFSLSDLDNKNSNMIYTNIV